MRLTILWRGTRDDAFYPCHTRGDDAHMRRGYHRITSPGHVAPDALHRDIAVPQPDPRQCFDFDISERCFLCLRESSDLLLRKTDVLGCLFRKTQNASLD